MCDFVNSLHVHDGPSIHKYTLVEVLFMIQSFCLKFLCLHYLNSRLVVKKPFCCHLTDKPTKRWILCDLYVSLSVLHEFITNLLHDTSLVTKGYYCQNAGQYRNIRIDINSNKNVELFKYMGTTVINQNLHL